MAAFEYRQAQEIRDVFQRHEVKCLFIGNSGAVLLGFPDATQTVEVLVETSATNCERLVPALSDLGFQLTDGQVQEIRRGKDSVQLKNGPFDLDLIFAPDGIEKFDAAWRRHVEVDGFPVCSIDDIIASKEATHRQKDRETLPRLLTFRAWLKRQGSAR